MSKKTPDWMTVGQDGIVVKLSRATELNGVKQDRISLRVPTVGDLRAAARHGNGDKETQEIHLFASLASCAPDDIERLTVKDYGRVQEGYFRLITDDDGPATEGAG